MIDPRHFRVYVIRPALKVIGLWSDAAERLVLGTALVESRLRYLHQIGGPALGPFQIEPSTHDDLWKHYFPFRQRLAADVQQLATLSRNPDQLAWNLGYGAAICRIIYWRRPEPLPAATDIRAMGLYWKEHYNTHLGKGKIEDWIRRAEPILKRPYHQWR